MLFKVAVLLLCCLAPLGSGCVYAPTAGRTPARGGAPQAAGAAESPAGAKRGADSGAAPASGARSSDACGLIERSEVASVQGIEVQEVRPTSQRYGDLDVSQCYYTAVTADGARNLSVYVQLIRPGVGSAGRDALKKFWEERFGREAREGRRGEREERREREERGGEDEGERINPPLRVSGVGDEAFWLGSSRGGALYVLRKDGVVRVTAAGSGDARDDVRRTKALAKKALARLP